MPSLQSIQKRIKSVKAVRKITSAMELVAATKMRRAQETALNSRPYAFTAFEMLANVVESATAQGIDLSQIPLLAVSTSALSSSNGSNPLQKPAGAARAILLVASDKGLAGTFNSAVFRKYEQYAARNFKTKIEEGAAAVIAVGQKAEDYARRRGLLILKSFTRQGDVIDPAEVEEIGEFLVNGFVSGKWSSLTAFSTNFVSALKQEALERELLPIDFEKIREGVNNIIPKTGRYSSIRESIESSRPKKPIEYIIEPSPEAALRKLVPALFKMQIYHIILESNASEHSARRIAMKNASDNAKELTDELTTIFNRARQEKITSEILEITGGARALAS